MGQSIMAGWTWRDYQEKDPAALLRLRASNPQLYKDLFEAHYGRKCVIEDEEVKRVTDPRLKAYENIHSFAVTSSWTWKDFKDKDPEQLIAMRGKHPERYKQLFEAHYGRKCVIE